MSLAVKRRQIENRNFDFLLNLHDYQTSSDISDFIKCNIFNHLMKLGEDFKRRYTGVIDNDVPKILTNPFLELEVILEEDENIQG